MIIDPSKRQLEEFFGSQVTFNFVEENLPLSVTMNDTVSKCVAHFGEFEAIMYLDSGVTFWDAQHRYDAIHNLFQIHKAHPSAITAAVCSNDSGREWLGWNFDPPNAGEYFFKVGQCTNLHVALFSHEYYSAYNRILIDSIASNCQESLFYFLCAAIKRKYIATQRICPLHKTDLDGASIGSRAIDERRKPLSFSFETGALSFCLPTDIDDIYRRGKEFGFGFESFKPYWQFDPSKYDENGFATDPRLVDFLKKELFLSKEQFDYSQIQAIFHPARQ